MPPDLFTAESKTLYSENGSGNLTMVWVNGHAVGFNVSAVLNTTSDAGETAPESWSFLFDWRADGEMLSADVGTGGGKVSAMPCLRLNKTFFGAWGFWGCSQPSFGSSDPFPML